MIGFDKYDNSGRSRQGRTIEEHLLDVSTGGLSFLWYPIRFAFETADRQIPAPKAAACILGHPCLVYPLAYDSDVKVYGNIC